MALPVAALAWSPGGFPNQLGQRPLRGWRSWQAVGGEVNQTIMEEVMARPDIDTVWDGSEVERHALELAAERLPQSDTA